MSKDLLMTKAEKVNMLVNANAKSYEEYKEIFDDAYQGGSTLFEFHSVKMYYFFVEHYDIIPDAYKLRILIDLITNDRAVGEDWFTYLILSMKAMPEKARSEINQEIKSQYGYLADENGFITIYKGKNKLFNKLQNEFDFNFTTDKDVAMWFAKRCCGDYEKNKSKIVAYRIHIDDILYYNNDRNEKEVIVAPISFQNDFKYKIKKLKTEMIKDN